MRANYYMEIEEDIADLENFYDNHDTCRLCGNVSVDFIRLRDRSSVCKQCADGSESRLYELRRRKQQIERDLNIWGKTELCFGFILVILALYLWWSYSIWYVVVIVAVIANLHGFFESKSEFLKKRELQIVEQEKEAIKESFIPIFELFFNYPPDWGWRMGQVRERDGRMCKKCGRKWYGSTVPFHVHHIIPVSDPGSSHKFENLTFLCELCHSKIDDLHNIVKDSRKKRLEMDKLYGKRRKKRNWGASATERASIYW